MSFLWSLQRSDEASKRSKQLLGVITPNPLAVNLLILMIISTTAIALAFSKGQHNSEKFIQYVLRDVSSDILKTLETVTHGHHI